MTEMGTCESRCPACETRCPLTNHPDGYHLCPICDNGYFVATRVECPVSEPASSGAGPKECPKCGSQDRDTGLMPCTFGAPHEWHKQAPRNDVAERGTPGEQETAQQDIIERLRAACNGHPASMIPWPHYLLHDAIAEIARLRAEAARLTEQVEAERKIGREEIERRMNLEEFLAAAEANLRDAKEVADAAKEFMNVSPSTYYGWGPETEIKMRPLRARLTAALAKLEANPGTPQPKEGQ